MMNAHRITRTLGTAFGGLLAVGLGIGAALAATPGVASADSSTDWLSSIDQLLGGLVRPGDDVQFGYADLHRRDWICSPQRATPRPPPRTAGTSRSPSATAPMPTPPAALATSHSPTAPTAPPRPASSATSTPPWSSAPTAPPRPASGPSLHSFPGPGEPTPLYIPTISISPPSSATRSTRPLHRQRPGRHRAVGSVPPLAGARSALLGDRVTRVTARGQRSSRSAQATTDIYYLPICNPRGRRGTIHRLP